MRIYYNNSVSPPLPPNTHLEPCRFHCCVSWWSDASFCCADYTTVDDVLPVQRRDDFITVSMFYVEFVVGICMFVIVTWLLLFRMKEVKECWKLHRRIRYYFCLTVLGTAVNLGLGICGTLFVAGGKDE